MNEYTNNWSSQGSVCEGCLSTDRNLSYITDEECRRLFSGFLNEMVSQQQLLLCWECSALLRRVLHFRNQVQKAQSILLKQVPTKSLSNLKTTNDSTIIDLKHVQSTQEVATAPLTFVKVEDDTLAGFDHDGCDSVALDTDFDLHEEPAVTSGIPDTIPDSNQTKMAASVSYTSMDGFNESDDEPLNSKRKLKPRGRRKKKDQDKPATEQPSDVKPAPKKRREQPPGVVHSPRVARRLQQLRVPTSRLEMLVLSWPQVEEERQRGLQSPSFLRHEHRCERCALGFNHRCKLEQHMIKHTQAAGTEECSVCHIFCRNKHALAAHRRRHRVRWRCTVCGGLWSRASVAADHAAREHGDPTPIHTCSLCGHTETTLAKLRNHLKSHAERVKCEECGKTFNDKTSLRTHLFIHKGEKEYGCGECGKRFLFRRALDVHRLTHDAHAHLYCHQCDMNFKNRISFNQHMKYSLKHVDPAKLKYACQLCDKKFLKATRLNEHNMAVHLKITPIQCTVPGCNFACSSRPVLRTHMRMLHRDARSQRNHVCDVCGKAYTTKSSLAGHMRSHTGERPFRCSRCPAAFAHDASLYNHTRLVHLKDKPTRGHSSNAPTNTETTMAPIQNLWPLTIPNITLSTHEQ